MKFLVRISAAVGTLIGFLIANILITRLQLSARPQAWQQPESKQESPALPENLTLNWANPMAASTCRSILYSYLEGNYRPAIPHTKSVTISGYSEYTEWDMVSRLFQALTTRNTKMIDVYWQNDVVIPKGILEGLNAKSPDIRLHYTPNIETFLDTDPISYVRDLSKSSILYSLKANIDPEFSIRSKQLELILDLVHRSRKLRHLDLILTPVANRTGLRAQDAFEFHPSDFTHFGLPSLKSLKISGYNFDTIPIYVQVCPWSGNKCLQVSRNGSTSSVFKGGELSVWNANYTNLQIWLKVMGWSHLHTLGITGTSNGTLKDLSGNVLPSLKSFGLAEVNPEDALHFFNSTHQGLETLSLQEVLFSIENLLPILKLKHSNTLKSFSIGNHNNTQSFSDSELSTLVSSLPNLEKLDINLSRASAVGPEYYWDQLALGWNVDALNPIINSPKITHLTLRFPLLDISIPDPWPESTSTQHRIYGDGRDPRDHFICRDSVLKLFSHLRKNRGGIPGLEHLEVYVGDYHGERGVDGYDIKRKIALSRTGYYSCGIDYQGKKHCW